MLDQIAVFVSPFNFLGMVLVLMFLVQPSGLKKDMPFLHRSFPAFLVVQEFSAPTKFCRKVMNNKVIVALFWDFSWVQPMVWKEFPSNCWRDSI